MRMDVEAAAKNIERAIADAGPFESNLLAVVTAESLGARMDKEEIARVSKFLQMLLAALKTYM